MVCVARAAMGGGQHPVAVNDRSAASVAHFHDPLPAIFRRHRSADDPIRIVQAIQVVCDLTSNKWNSCWTGCCRFGCRCCRRSGCWACCSAQCGCSFRRCCCFCCYFCCRCCLGLGRRGRRRFEWAFRMRLDGFDDPIPVAGHSVRNLPLA